MHAINMMKGSKERKQLKARATITRRKGAVCNYVN